MKFSVITGVNAVTSDKFADIDDVAKYIFSRSIINSKRILPMTYSYSKPFRSRMSSQYKEMKIYVHYLQTCAGIVENNEILIFYSRMNFKYIFCGTTISVTFSKLVFRL